MAHNVFSSVKVSSRRTMKGVHLSAIGIGTILCLIIMLLVSFFAGGKLPTAAGALGYISFFVAALALRASLSLRVDDDAYGPMVHSAFYINTAAVTFHAVIFLIGCMSMIS